MLNECPDYSEAYAFVDTLVRECHKVATTPVDRQATEDVAHTIRLLLSEFQKGVDPKLVVHLMRCTALLGSFLVDTVVPESLFRKMQPYRARKTKGIEDADRARRLDEAVLAECAAKKRTIADSIKLANVILPGVRTRLGYSQDDWQPTAATIRVALRRLRAAKSRVNDRAIDKPALPEESSGLHQMPDEWSDYSRAYALVDTFLKLSYAVEETPSARRANEKIADAIRLLLPEFQYQVHSKLVMQLIAYTAWLGRFQVNTSTSKRRFGKSQASTARTAKEIKDADRAQELDDAVRAECAEQGRIAISIEFATLIQPRVLSIGVEN